MLAEGEHDRASELQRLVDQGDVGPLRAFVENLTIEELESSFGLAINYADLEPYYARKMLGQIGRLYLDFLVEEKTKKRRKELAEKIRCLFKTYFLCMFDFTTSGHKFITKSRRGSAYLMIHKVLEHENIIELADELRTKNERLSNSAIAKILRQKHGITLAESTIRNIIKKRKASDKTVEDPFQL